MANEINKLEGAGIVFTPPSKPTLPVNANQTTKTSAIALSIHLDQMVAMLSEEAEPDQTQRVMQLKQQVSSGNYVIDLDKLSDKLTQAVIGQRDGI